MSSLQRLCALVVSVVVMTSAARDLDFFEAAFGKKTHLYHHSVDKAHDLFEASHRLATKRILKQSTSERPGHFLGCSAYNSADKAVEALTQEYGKENVRTIMSSKTELNEGLGLTCFLVHPNSMSPSLFDAKSYLQVWLPVPASMKLSADAHTLLESLLLAAQQTAADSHLAVPAGAGVMDQLVSSELEVNIGKTVTKGTVEQRRARSNDVVASIRESLKIQSRDAAARSTGLAELSAMMPHIEAWQAVASQVQAASRGGGHVRRQLTDKAAQDCNFDKLVFSAHDEFLFITHMHELANPACFATVLATVALEPDVLSANPTDMYRPLLDLVGDMLHSGVATEGRAYQNVGLTGSGVVVGLLDGGVDEYSCFFDNVDGILCPRSLPGAPTHDTTRRKVIQYTYTSDSIEDAASGHGTGMAGIICGEDSTGTYPDHFGVAPGAKIALYDHSSSSANIAALDDNLDVYFDVALTTGAKLYSASFGNRYTDYVARDVVNDQYAVDNDFLLIAAVGHNSLSNIVTSPGRSKNALSVGSSGTSGDDDPNSLGYFSSTGPTPDGRFGVDVLAHGVDVLAPKSAGYTDGVTAASCAVVSRTGTSSSTAAVAGVAALVQEYFQNSSFWAASCNQNYDYCAAGAAVPKSILIKTVVIHSGQDIGNSLAYPGNEQGFGRVQLNAVLAHPGVTATGFDLYVEEAVLTAGGTLTWTVTVASNTIPLKATIAWVDPANIVSASKQLLNDVDLIITDESGTVTYGNNNAAGDSSNNVEMAYIASPTPGDYVVSISIGTLGAGASQAVSLVITSYGTVDLAGQPTGVPSSKPSQEPSLPPTGEPSGQPSTIPSRVPTKQPTGEPSGAPSNQPTGEPSGQPSTIPSRVPTKQPTGEPSGVPTKPPTGEPSGQPSTIPSRVPTKQPTGEPSGVPTKPPTGEPSGQPSTIPTGEPTKPPTGEPSGQPSTVPTGEPTKPPTGEPSGQPSIVPTGEPTKQPSGEPSAKPSSTPSGQPSGQPTGAPTHQPNYNRPSARPVFAYSPPTPAPVPAAPTAAPVTPSVEPPTDRAPTVKPTFTL